MPHRGNGVVIRRSELRTLVSEGAAFVDGPPPPKKIKKAKSSRTRLQSRALAGPPPPSVPRPWHFSQGRPRPRPPIQYMTGVRRPIATLRLPTPPRRHVGQIGSKKVRIRPPTEVESLDDEESTEDDSSDEEVTIADREDPNSRAIIDATYSMLAAPHGHRTRSTKARQAILVLNGEHLKDFNTRFRSMPVEIRSMIFANAITWNGRTTPKLIVGLRADKNQQLYQEALRVFFRDNTFNFVSEHNIDNVQDSLQLMPAPVWTSVRSMTLAHLLRHPRFGGLYALRSSYFTTYRLCDVNAIRSAKNTHTLRVDFRHSNHCILPTILEICKTAVLELRKLERLELVLSDIRCHHSYSDIPTLIWTLNIGMNRTGMLLTVGTHSSSKSVNGVANATDIWFWQSQPNQTLLWNARPDAPPYLD